MNMSQYQSRQLVLKKKPSHVPTDEDFDLITIDVGEPAEGQVLVRNLWMSVDPYQVAMMQFGVFPVGQVPEGRAAGKVIASRSPDFRPGDYVMNHLAWREYVLADASKLEKVTPKAGRVRDYIGPLGITGLTAYVGIFPIGKIKAGESVFVSGAAGAVGMIAVQLAKAHGCYVVGTAGTDEKCRWLEDVARIDKAINYKTCGDIFKAIGAAFPKGIDVYFDNVAGDQLKAALQNMNYDGRVAVCGLMTSHSPNPPAYDNSLLGAMIMKSLRFEGVNADRNLHHIPEFRAEMERLVAAGKMKWEDTYEEGLENALKAMQGMYVGKNTGKMLVKLGPDND
jgi:NADPH-dependent curcumin reductase CurA